MKFIKAVYAGNLMGVAIIASWFTEGVFASALAFSFCIFVAAVLSLPLFVGRVSRILVKEETVGSLVVIAAGNVMGLLVDLMLIYPAVWFNDLRLMIVS